MSDSYWRQPLAWNLEARAASRRDRVFCASMADVFEKRKDLDVSRQRLWRLIDETPNLDWLLLTKRPEQVGQLVPWVHVWPNNVWLGTTVETQRWAEKRIPLLLEQPAIVSFLSCEPLLGSMDLTRWLKRDHHEPRISWIIVGGESGHRARPMNPDWARALRDQCKAHGVAFHFKQWGNWRPTSGQPNGKAVRSVQGANGDPIIMVNMGKKAAGRKLDEQRWDELPQVA